MYRMCNVRPADRVACPGAYIGMTSSACHALGCCYDSRILIGQRCFEGLSEGKPITIPQFRFDPDAYALIKLWWGWVGG